VRALRPLNAGVREQRDLEACLEPLTTHQRVITRAELRVQPLEPLACLADMYRASSAYCST
jgi:hypothetical protein